jgi:MFS family permease
VWGFSRNVKLYFACILLRSAAFALYELFLNLYLLSLGFDTAFIGLCSTLLGVASLVCALPAGVIADRIGRRRAMIVGLLGISFTHLGLSVSSQGWAIISFYVLYGVLTPFLFSSIAPFLTENSVAEERATLFTFSASLMNLAWFVATIAGGYLPALLAPPLNTHPESTLAYRSVMLLSSVATFAAIIPILLIKDTPTVPRPRVHASRHITRRFSDPVLLLKLALPRLCFAFGAGLFFPFLNIFFKQRFGVSDAALGWILGITSAVAVPTMLLGGPVADRLGKIRTMLLARLVSTPLLLVIGLAPSLPIAVAAHWLRSGFMRVGQPLYSSFAMEQLPERERATGSSLLSMSWDAGWSTAPLVSGLVQMRTGFTPLILATTGCYVLGVLAVYGFFVRPPRDEAT